MSKRIGTRLSFANVMSCAALFVALGGTSYGALRSDGDDRGTAGMPPPADPQPTPLSHTDPPPPAAPGVLDTSFVFQQGNPIRLPAAPPQYSQVNFLTSAYPAASGGRLQVKEPGELHAEAQVLLRRDPGTGRSAFCHVLVNGVQASHWGKVTFSDTGREPDGTLAHPTLMMPLVATIDVEPGTYNVGVRCHAQEANLVEMDRTELHAVVYRR